MDNSHTILLIKELQTEKIDHIDAKKHWERLRRAILSNCGTRSCENGSVIHDLKVQKKSIKKKKCCLRKSFEKSIQDARSALENAELKSEHANTIHKKEVTDMKRKMVISEHSKMIEKAFEEGRHDAGRKPSIDLVANSLRLIRKMEAQHDRLRARKMRLKEAARKTMKKKKRENKNNENREQRMEIDNDEQQEDIEMEWQGNEEDKQEDEEGNCKKGNEITLNNNETKMEYIEVLTTESNSGELKGQAYTSDLPNLGKTKWIEMKRAMKRVKASQRYERRTNAREKLPSVFETETDNIETAEGNEAELIDGLHGHQNECREVALSNGDKQNETKLPLLNGTSKTLPKNKMKSKNTSQYNSQSNDYNLPDIHNRNIENTTESSYGEDTSGLNYFNQNVTKNNRSSSITMKTNKETNSFPRLVKTGEYSQLSSESLRAENIKDLRSSYEDTMPPSDWSTSDKVSPLAAQYKNRDMSFSDSLWSSLTRNSSLDLATTYNRKRSVGEIYNALRDVGLDAKAAELDELLKNMIEDEQYLEEKLNDVKKALQKETERIKMAEKEDLKIAKMKLQYHRYKKREEERRKKEELKQKLKKEAEKKIQKQRKLYREMVMLAMENSISRNYNFSYFTRMNPKTEDKIG